VASYPVICSNVLVAMRLKHQGGGRFSATGCDTLHLEAHAGALTPYVLHAG